MRSRIVAGLELMLIVLPTTVLALGGVLMVASSTFTTEMAALASALAVALVAIAGVWRLLVPLLLGHDRAAPAAARAWWLAVWVGGAFVLIGLVVALLASRLLEPTDRSRGVVGSATIVAFFGVPMLIPLAHLVLEALRGKRSNNSLEGDACKATRASG